MSHFLPLYVPPKNPKNQNFEKMEKIAGDIIILHKCNKNHSHMRYGLRFRVKLTDFLYIFAHFLSFYPPNNPENQNFENMKKASGRHHFTHVYQKSRSYFLRYRKIMLAEIWSARHVLSFWGNLLPFYPIIYPEN